LWGSKYSRGFDKHKEVGEVLETRDYKRLGIIKEFSEQKCSGRSFAALREIQSQSPRFFHKFEDFFVHVSQIF